MMEMTSSSREDEMVFLVAACQAWARAFGTAPLDPADAADLLAGALHVTNIVARAAEQLTWQTPDAFIAMMQEAERSNGH